MQVDCARNGKNTCDNFNVNGFPTLTFFKDGKKGFDYAGPKNAGKRMFFIMLRVV